MNRTLLFSETSFTPGLHQHLWNEQRRLCKFASMEKTEPEKREGNVLIFFKCVFTHPHANCFQENVFCTFQVIV